MVPLWRQLAKFQNDEKYCLMIYKYFLSIHKEWVYPIFCIRMGTNYP